MSAIALDPLIAEARERARRRRFLALAAAGLIAAGLLAFELASSGGGAHGAIPWLPTKPNIGPAHPPLAPACTASQLKVSADMQALTGGMSGGGIFIANSSSTPCSLTGRPHLLAADGTPLRVNGWAQSWLRFDPLAPPLGSLRALRPGRPVTVALLSGAFCYPPVRRTTGALLLRAPGGGRVRLHDSEFGNTLVGVRCFPGPGNLAATRFTPVVADGGPSTRLPLRARIVSTGTPSLDGNGKPDGDKTLVARAGSWLSFTLVLTNTSKHVFRFGRTCPAYTEGIGLNRRQAYVLNCHSAGAIAPGASVRFLMRVQVPSDATNWEQLTWILAPHSYHAPEANALLELP